MGCGSDPNEKANELFVEAVQLIGSAEKQTWEAAIKGYEQGLANIQTIIDGYSESDLAVKLISGETLFTGKSLKEVKKRVKELKRVAIESAMKVIEKAVRVELKKPTGKLTQAQIDQLQKALPKCYIGSNPKK